MNRLIYLFKMALLWGTPCKSLYRHGELEAGNTARTLSWVQNRADINDYNLKLTFQHSMKGVLGRRWLAMEHWMPWCCSFKYGTLG